MLTRRAVLALCFGLAYGPGRARAGQNSAPASALVGHWTGSTQRNVKVDLIVTDNPFAASLAFGGHTQAIRSAKWNGTDLALILDGGRNGTVRVIDTSSLQIDIWSGSDWMMAVLGRR